ncbi:MAG: hypothetical protein V1697_02370 [Candidatus Levyibacteriota bacterium]
MNQAETKTKPSELEERDRLATIGDLNKIIEREVNGFASKQFGGKWEKRLLLFGSLMLGNRKPFLYSETRSEDHEPSNVQDFYDKIDELARKPETDTSSSAEKARHARQTWIITAQALLKEMQKSFRPEKEFFRECAKQAVKNGNALSQELDEQEGKVDEGIMNFVLDAVNRVFDPKLGDIEVKVFTDNSIPENPQK